MSRRQRRKRALEAESLQGELLGSIEAALPQLPLPPSALTPPVVPSVQPATPPVPVPEPLVRSELPPVPPTAPLAEPPTVLPAGSLAEAPSVTEAPSDASRPASASPTPEPPAPRLSEPVGLLARQAPKRKPRETPRSPGRANEDEPVWRGAAGHASKPSPPHLKSDVALAPGTGDRHESARDHAAAGARPAGEPLVRARTLVEQGRVQEAIQLYLGILTVNPENLKARNNLGVLFDELKQFDAARDHFEAAARLEPENVEVLTNLASTLTSLARYEEAESMIRRAQSVDADDPRVRLAVGILFFRRGLYAQAETELRWVCARDRESGPAFYYRGEALNRLGRYDDAVQALERAAVLLPNDPKPVYTLGHLYDRRHQPKEAAEMYRRARRLQSR